MEFESVEDAESSFAARCEKRDTEYYSSKFLGSFDKTVYGFHNLECTKRQIS